MNLFDDISNLETIFSDEAKSSFAYQALLEKFLAIKKFGYSFSEVKWSKRTIDLSLKFERFTQGKNFGQDSAMEIGLDEFISPNP